MLRQLQSLFETDVRLKKTIPATYELDPEKVEKWNRLKTMKGALEEVRLVHFAEWQASFENVLEEVYRRMQNGTTFIMSTGKSPTEQSASELWTFYIAQKVLEINGVKFEQIDDFWTRVSITKGGEEIHLFIDDFVNSGCHMAGRIGEVASACTGKILVAVAVGPRMSDILDCVKDREEEYKVLFSDRLDLIAGLTIDGSVTFLFDHKSLEELRDDIYMGYLGMGSFGQFKVEDWTPIYMGSLMNIADDLTEFQHPPALYHIEFGSGHLKKRQQQLIPLEGYPGFFTCRQ